MNINAFTPQIQSVLQEAENTAIKMHRHCVDMDLFFDNFLDNLSLSCQNILEDNNLKQSLYNASDEVISKKKKTKNCSSNHCKDLVQFFNNCCESASEMFGLDYVPPEIVFLNFLDIDLAPKAVSSVILKDKDLVDKLITEITFSLSDVDISMLSLLEEEISNSLLTANNESKKLEMFKDNEVLSQFAENLNIKASNNKFDKIVDFDDKISEIATILCRKKKPNVILVGTAGTGKTSLVEGLVNKIVNGEAPELLSDKVIYSVSLSSMVAGTTYRGQFEQRLEEFVNEAKKYDNVVLFIDEIHTLVGAGGSGGSNESLEASNILKPELARGTISCIGATTIKEYNATIKKDSALDRRFERVIVREPSKFQMKKILPTIMSHYEDFHNVKYSTEFTENVIEYCEKFSPNKHYPDKAVDVVDHCGAQAKVSYFGLSSEKNNDIPLVELNHLSSFFSRKESPLSDISRLDEMFFDLGKKFAGHNKLINQLKEKIIISNYNISSNGLSPSVFCINGGAKRGKTHLMSTFKENFERSGANVLKYNGIHFSDPYSINKIVSVENGASSLCQKILMYPNSIIIIDDFDCIHQSSLALFAQIFKDGKLELENGDCADFSHCRFFITSKILSENKLGFGSSEENQKSAIIPELASKFSANLFLHGLNEKALRRVLWNKLNTIKSGLSVKSVDLDFNFDFIKKFTRAQSKSKPKIESLSESFDSKINKYVQNRLIKGDKKIKLKNIK